MNFYKHHIGDYAQATSHLSFVEDAAYSRLIRKYYAEESPLPAEIKSIQRLVGARTREEKQAVEDVLNEFFELRDDGWHNKRCDAEIAKANAQAETNRQIAIEREARKKQRIASNETSTNRDEKSHESSNESLHESSASREPSQTPDSRHQTPDIHLVKGGGESTVPEQEKFEGRKTSPPPPQSHFSNTKFAMHHEWEPSDNFDSLCVSAGMRIGDDPPVDQLYEFRTYWLTRPDITQNQAGWEHKFIKNLMAEKARIAK